MNSETKQTIVSCAGILAVALIFHTIASCSVALGEQSTREREALLKFKTEAAKAGFEVTGHEETRKTR